MNIGLIQQTIKRTYSRCNKVDEVRLYASYKLNLLLLKGQRCVHYTDGASLEITFTVPLSGSRPKLFFVSIPFFEMVLTVYIINYMVGLDV